MAAFGAIAAGLVEAYLGKRRRASQLDVALGIPVLLDGIEDSGKRGSTVQRIAVVTRHTGYAPRAVT